MNTDSIFEVFEKKNKENEALAKPYVELLVNALKMDDRSAQLIVDKSCDFSSMKTPFSKMTEEEIVDLVRLYISLFGSPEMLCKFLDAQEFVDTGYDLYIRKKTIFHLKYEIVEARILNLMELFNVSKEKCIQIVISHPDWLYHKKEFICSKFEEMSLFWNLTKGEIVQRCLQSPFIFSKKLDKLNDRIIKLETHYGVKSSEIKKLMLLYPALMNKGVSFFTENKLTKDIFVKPWLLECLIGYDNCNFGGYRTFQNMLLLIEHIEKHFGDIIKFIKKKYKDCGFLCVIAKKGDAYYLVSIGSNYVSEAHRKNAPILTPEEKLLNQIFGSKAEPNAYQEYHDHREYFIKIKDVDIEDVEAVLYLMASASAKNARSNSKQLIVQKSPSTKILTSGFVLIDDLVNAPNLDVEENRLLVNFINLSFKKVDDAEWEKLSNPPVEAAQDDEDFDFDDDWDFEDE